MKVHILHENPDWLGPFVEALEREGVDHEEWFLAGGTIDLERPPPRGVFWSRMSASSHTRGHTLAKDHARAVLAWLEAHGRRIVNGRRVLEMEMSKVEQLTALAAHGFDVPRTVAVVGPTDLLGQARRFPAPFILKHNQGGKGIGVRRFDAHVELERWLASDDGDAPVDGITLLQEYVEPAQPFVTRVEIVDGQMVYALAADTRQGFELCPADACTADDGPSRPGGGQLFELRRDFADPIVERYLSFADRHGIEVAGFEFIETAEGRQVTYDINTNTNYNPAVDADAPRSGPREVARFLARLVAAEERRA